MNTVKISLEGGNSIIRNILEPKFDRGWWTDINNKPITQALLSDTVRFNIQTTGISNGRKIEITLMGSDGLLNPDDQVSTYNATIQSSYCYIDILLDDD